jgi:protein-L-isoaspartate O-methyltransferase
MFTPLFLKILNKKASSAKSKPAEIIASLNIREGDIIADIGSGGGYFTLAFAGKAGKTDRVYAVDVKPRSGSGTWLLTLYSDSSGVKRTI